MIGRSDEAPVVAAVPQLAAGDRSLRLLTRVGAADPANLDAYRAAGGYEALRRALAIGPAAVIREVTDSGLVGRGGAAFPTGRKWEAVARHPVRPHHLVCNADESEPGTFKDRVLMEGDPFAVIESMTIAAYATGCEHGWIYVRGEYPRATRTLHAALDAARQRGFLGDDILGTGFGFDITVFRGAGAYICGEETAIFNSIEGFRGEPRNKPPFPVDAGLFGQPTVVNNVETLVNVLPILLDGGAAFASVGTSGSTGPKLFCVSGAVAAPGVYEVEFGMTLGELIELAGGVRPGAGLRAVLLGGAAGGFVGPDELDVPLTLEGAREHGTTLGSGVVLVLDDTVDLVDQLRRIAAFFRDESCGQCVPCRVGTVRQEEVLARLARRELIARRPRRSSPTSARSCATPASAGSARPRRSRSSRRSTSSACFVRVSELSPLGRVSLTLHAGCEPSRPASRRADQHERDERLDGRDHVARRPAAGRRRVAAAGPRGRTGRSPRPGAGRRRRPSSARSAMAPAAAGGAPAVGHEQHDGGNEQRQQHAGERQEAERDQDHPGRQQQRRAVVEGEQHQHARSGDHRGQRDPAPDSLHRPRRRDAAVGSK